MGNEFLKVAITLRRDGYFTDSLPVSENRSRFFFPLPLPQIGGVY